MRKLLLSIVGIFAFCAFAEAGMEEWSYPPSSSYTEVATLGPVVFSTGPTRWEAIIVSSPAPDSHVVFFRSTSPFITPDITTQTLIVTSFVPSNQSPVTIDLYGITNASYTLVSKVGTAKITYVFRLIGGAKNVTPPGLKASGGQ